MTKNHISIKIHIKHGTMYTNNETMELVFLEYMRLYIIMVVFYRYLQRDSDKAANVYVSNCLDFERSTYI